MIQRKFHSKWIQPLNPEIGLKDNSIQRRIQPLNLQIGFNINSVQRDIQPLNPKIGFNYCQFQSKTDSTIKQTNRIPFKDGFNN